MSRSGDSAESRDVVVFVRPSQAPAEVSAIVMTISFDAGAAAYDRFTGLWSRTYIPSLLRAAEITVGQWVIDVATGTGEAAVLAASLVGPSGKVLAVDISLPMLRVAQAKLGDRPIALLVMDGEALGCRDYCFDAVICQLGLMFFSDVRRGLQEFQRVLRPGGRLAVCVWSTPERVPLFAILAEALARQRPTERDVLYQSSALADAHRLHGLLAGAGFGQVGVTRETRAHVFESFDDYWSPVEAGAGRFGQCYLELPEAARQTVRDEVREHMARFESNGRLVMHAEVILGIARHQ